MSSTTITTVLDAASGADQRRWPRIASLSTVFPNPAETGKGLFVRSRLERVAASAQVVMVAPILALNLSRLNQRWHRLPKIPPRLQDGRLDVVYPRWAKPPGGGVLQTAYAMYLQLRGPMRRLRGEFSFDVIDSHFGYPEGVAACLLARDLGVPFIATLRGCELLHAGYPVRRRVMSWALRQALRVFTVSEELHEFALRLGCDPAKVKTIPNGVDSTLFYPRPKEEMRRKHDIAAEARVILTASRLTKIKGVDRALRALRAIRDQGVPAQLLIAGGVDPHEPRNGARLERLAARLKLGGSVRFLGEVSPATLAELMSAADVFCLPSGREGWPNVVHEAQGCGAPAVASDCGAIRDMIPSERYGFVIPIGDEAALREALEKALSRRWDSAAISEWAHSRSWEQVADEALAEIRLALTEKT